MNVSDLAAHIAVNLVNERVVVPATKATVSQPFNHIDAIVASVRNSIDEYLKHEPS